MHFLLCASNSQLNCFVLPCPVHTHVSDIKKWIRGTEAMSKLSDNVRKHGEVYGLAIRHTRLVCTDEPDQVASHPSKDPVPIASTHVPPRQPRAPSTAEPASSRLPSSVHTTAAGAFNVVSTAADAQRAIEAIRTEFRRNAEVRDTSLLYVPCFCLYYRDMMATTWFTPPRHCF